MELEKLWRKGFVFVEKMSFEPGVLPDAHRKGLQKTISDCH